MTTVFDEMVHPSRCKAPTRRQAGGFSRAVVAGILASMAILQRVDAEPLSLEAALASKLGQFSEQSPGLFSVTNGLIVLGDHQLKVMPTLEKEVEMGDKRHAAAVRFEVIVDGRDRPDFSLGTVGLGPDKAEARDAAITEWYWGFGISIFRAFSGLDPALVVRDYAVHPGYMGVRGDRPAGWMDGSEAMNRKLLEHIFPVLATLDVIALDLKLTVPPAGALDGECRVNGRVSVGLTDRLKQLDWPRGNSPYMFKQAYVLVKKKKL